MAAFRQRPLLFNGITGGVLCATSDAIAQQIEDANERTIESSGASEKDAAHVLTNSIRLPTLDIARVASAGIIGMFFGGLVYPKAYAKLDAIWVGTKFSAVLQKSIVEIATVGIFVNSISMASRGFFRGDKKYDEVAQHVVIELPTVTRNDVLVWLPYNLVAFSFIPAVLRPTTTAMMEASWQTYISLRAHDFE